MNEKRKPIINTHCHFLNLKFIPGEMVELLSHITEYIANDDWFEVGAGLLFQMAPGNEFKRINRFLRTYKLPIDRVVKEYIKKMDEAGIDLCVPLMIDFEMAIPESVDREGIIPYYKKNKECQINLISRQVASYPWRIFPFIMFDPRRKKSVDICIDALENKGFIGIKMYPALGYHPCPNINRNPGAYWSRYIKKGSKIAERLERLYEYCSNGRVPITTHFDVDGAYTSQRLENSPWYVNNLIKLMELNKIREKEVWPLSELFNWLYPIEEYKLKINFAHLGGNYLNGSKKTRNKAERWRRQILNYISLSFQSPEQYGQIYSDLSYHYMALLKKTRQPYFEDLRKILNSDNLESRILFGTDAALLSHTWKEKEYMEIYQDKKNLSKEQQEKIFSDNPIHFLFNDGKIPESYIKFLEKHNPYAFKSLPAWVIKNGDEYYIVNKNILGGC